jgi:hypothetical protein
MACLRRVDSGSFGRGLGSKSAFSAAHETQCLQTNRQNISHRSASVIKREREIKIKTYVH